MPTTYSRWHISYSVERRKGSNIVGAVTTNVAPPAPWPLTDAALAGLEIATRTDCERRYGPDVEDVLLLSAVPLA